MCMNMPCTCTNMYICSRVYMCMRKHMLMRLCMCMQVVPFIRICLFMIRAQGGTLTCVRAQIRDASFALGPCTLCARAPASAVESDYIKWWEVACSASHARPARPTPQLGVRSARVLCSHGHSSQLAWGLAVSTGLWGWSLAPIDGVLSLHAGVNTH